MTDKIPTLDNVYALVTEFLVKYAFQVLGAALILLAGVIVSGMVSKALLRAQQKRQFDVTLSGLIARTVRAVVLAFFAVIALANLGISIAPLLAAVGGLAVGAGVALQGLVSNYGAGLSIILGRMFRVGDTIEVVGCAGVVTEITLASTRLRTDDGEDVIIPNRKIVGEVHRNSYRYRVVDTAVGILYGADPLEAVAVIQRVLAEAAGVARDRSPQVGIERFADNTLRIGYRYWVPSEQLVETRHAVNAAVYAALLAAGIALAPNTTSTTPVATPVG